MEKRVALITGGNRGIGLEVCRQLSERGFHVILTGRDRAKAERAARALAGPGREIVALELDVADQTSIGNAEREVAGQFGHVDVLVNNAAVLLGGSDPVLKIPQDVYRATFETNVFGAVAVSRAFVPGMIERGYGRVVNVSSGAGQLTNMRDYAPAYSMSKAALNALTRQLASAANGSGVLVNCADPGWVRTRMGGSTAPRSVEEGADTIVWLATLPADGPTGGFFSDRRQVEW